MRVLMLMGAYRPDLAEMPDGVVPVVAGALDETVWAHETQVETEQRWAPMREAFDLGCGGEYEWREVWVELDDDAARAHFTVPTLTGTVEAPASQGTQEVE